MDSAGSGSDRATCSRDGVSQLFTACHALVGTREAALLEWSREDQQED